MDGNIVLKEITILKQYNIYTWNLKFNKFGLLRGQDIYRKSYTFLYQPNYKGLLMHYSYVVVRNYPMNNAFPLSILYKSMALEMKIMTSVVDLQNVNK